MSSPRHAERRPAQDARTAEKTTDQMPAPRTTCRDNSRPQRRKRPPIAYFLEFAPVGRRHKFEQIVLNCPAAAAGCPGGHVHRSTEPITGGWRNGSCGVRYLLVPARSARIPRPRATGQLELRAVSA